MGVQNNFPGGITRTRTECCAFGQLSMNNEVTIDLKLSKRSPKKIGTANLKKEEIRQSLLLQLLLKRYWKIN